MTFESPQVRLFLQQYLLNALVSTNNVYVKMKVLKVFQVGTNCISLINHVVNYKSCLYFCVLCHRSYWMMVTLSSSRIWESIQKPSMKLQVCKSMCTDLVRVHTYLFLYVLVWSMGGWMTSFLPSQPRLASQHTLQLHDWHGTSL